MKFLSLIPFLLTISQTLKSQIVTIQDEIDLQPIENVIVFGDDQKKYQLTDLKGQVDISIFNGSEKIYFQHPSYELLEISFENALKTRTINLHENNIKLSEIVIAANKWAQNRSEISANITSISPKQIELENPQTSADLIGNTGEVFIQKSQLGGGSPMIRGFSTNRLLIAVDGVRMNTAIFRSGNLQNIISIDPFSVEQTEVFFGPGSVIYGSDAIGGVMSFNTIKPKFTQNEKPLIKATALSRYSSASNEFTKHFNFNIGWKKFAVASSITHNKYSNLKMGSNGPDEYLRPEYVERINGVDSVLKNDDPEVQIPTGYSQTNFMQKIRFSPNNNWDVNYGFHYSTTTDYPRYDRHLRYKNGLPRSAEWNYGPQIWIMNNIELQHTNSTLFYDEFSIRLAQQFFEESRIDRDFGNPDRDRKWEKVKALSSNIDFHKKINNKHQMFYGIEAVFNDVNSTAESENILTGVKSDIAARYPMSTWESYAVYMTYSFEVYEKLRLNIGSRYNQFILKADFDTTFYPFPFTTANINNGALTGSIGLVYNPSQDLWIHTNVSSGFRSPNIDDIGKIFDSEPGAVVVPNPDLDAEYAYNAEFAISKVFNDIIKCEITVFYTFLENALVRRDFLLNGQDSIVYSGEMSKVQAVQNAAKANVYGWQAGVDVKLPMGFSLKSRFNFQKGEEEMDNGESSPSRHAAPMFGTTHLIYAAQKIKCDIYTVYSAEVSNNDLSVEEQRKDYLYAIDNNGKPYSPAWYTLNLKALYQVNKNFSITAGIENITNQRYRPYSSGIVAPGRNFILALKAKF